MENRRTVLICDNDYAFLNEMEKKLAGKGYDVDTIDNASDLIPSVIRLKPHVIVANPDMQAFNEYDVCKYVIKAQHIPVILLLNADSTTRAQIDECQVEDVITKPVNVANLANLLAKHISVHQ